MKNCKPGPGAEPNKAPAQTSQAPESPKFDAQALLQGAGEFRLVFSDQIYTVRVTVAGKLIMTK